MATKDLLTVTERATIRRMRADGYILCHELGFFTRIDGMVFAAWRLRKSTAISESEPTKQELVYTRRVEREARRTAYKLQVRADREAIYAIRKLLMRMPNSLLEEAKTILQTYTQIDATRAPNPSLEINLTRKEVTREG